jgi:hypothetical protein
MEPVNVQIIIKLPTGVTEIKTFSTEGKGILNELHSLGLRESENGFFLHNLSTDSKIGLNEDSFISPGKYYLEGIKK